MSIMALLLLPFIHQHVSATPAELDALSADHTNTPMVLVPSDTEGIYTITSAAEASVALLPVAGVVTAVRSGAPLTTRGVAVARTLPRQWQWVPNGTTAALVTLVMAGAVVVRHGWIQWNKLQDSLNGSIFFSSGADSLDSSRAVGAALDGVTALDSESDSQASGADGIDTEVNTGAGENLSSEDTYSEEYLDILRGLRDSSASADDDSVIEVSESAVLSKSTATEAERDVELEAMGQYDFDR